MPATEARFLCRHILADGRRCRSACLRHEEFCYFHHASRKPVANPAERKGRRSVFTIPRIEDRASILLAINEILARIAANDIDARRAGRLLYAIQIASCSMPRLAALKPSSDDEDSDLVEEVVLHPTLGEIAPRSELTPPPERKSLAQSLREEMEELDARNIAEFGASAGTEAEDDPVHTPIPIQLNEMRIELREALEALARAKAELAQARADTLRAEEGMVWHMDRRHAACAELESLKSATPPQPETIHRIQAVAQPKTLPRTHAVTHSETLPRLHAVAHSETLAAHSRRRRPRHTPRRVILSAAKDPDAANGTHTARTFQPLSSVILSAGCPIFAMALSSLKPWASAQGPSSEARPFSSPHPQPRHSKTPETAHATHTAAPFSPVFRRHS